MNLLAALPVEEEIEVFNRLLVQLAHSIDGLDLVDASRSVLARFWLDLPDLSARFADIYGLPS